MDEVDHSTGADFFGVYLLYCLNPRYKGRTYIGFTVDPNRRIKQHNGGVQKGGANRTSGRGPWEMILIVHGFPSDIIALQFEWAWQNPEKSRRLRYIAKKKAKENGQEYRFRVLSAMLKVGPWNRLPLTIRWLKQEYRKDFDIDQQPPIHMPIVFGPLNKRKPRKTRQTADSGSQHENAHSKCVECASKIKVGEDWLLCLREGCSMKGHLTCLAQRFLCDSKEKFFCLPIEGQCPVCQETFLWRDLIKQSSHSEEQSVENASSSHWADKLR